MRRRSISLSKQKHELRISYDNTSDILYISFGEPQFGIDEEIDIGIYLRVNPQTSKPNGLGNFQK